MAYVQMKQYVHQQSAMVEPRESINARMVLGNNLPIRPDEPRRKIPMIDQSSQRPNFDHDLLMENLLANLFEQNVSLSKSTWCLLIDFFDKSIDLFGQRGKAQIGLELLLQYSKVPADALYKYTVLEKSENPKKTDAIRNRAFDKRFASLLQDLQVPSLRIELDSGQFSTDIKAFLMKKSMVQALIDVVSSISPNRLDEEVVKAVIQRISIYTVDKIESLRGCSLRDGILICKIRLTDREGDPRFLADAYTLSVHECAHVLTGYHFNDFQLSSPICNAPEGASARPDLQDMSDLGRAVELAIFGGLENGMEVFWGVSSVDAANDFLNRVQTYQSPPLYKNKNECIRVGMSEREIPSYSSGACFVDEKPLID